MESSMTKSLEQPKASYENTESERQEQICVDEMIRRPQSQGYRKFEARPLIVTMQCVLQMVVTGLWIWSNRTKVGDCVFGRSAHCKGIVLLERYLVRRERRTQEASEQLRNARTD